MTLNRNPENYHAEVEQSAFTPSHLVPGIEPSMDKMLQGRLFSYPDTHRYRLGKNYEQIPINCPYRARVASYIRDGAATVNGNYGGQPNYEPNTLGGPKEDPKYAWSKFPVSGEVGRYPYQHPNTYFEQPRALYETVFTEKDRELDLEINQIPYKDRDHAWFIAFGPYKDPRYSVSILVEHGGSGSKAAAPIAKKLFKLIIDRHEERIKVNNNNSSLKI